MLESQKHLFRLRPDIHYLNCSYKAPLLIASEEAAIQALIRERNPIDITPADFFKEPKEVKALFAELINGLPANIAFIPSVAYGFASVLKNIIPQKGQHAICVENEFPSGYFAIKKWCDVHGAELKVIKPDRSQILIGESWNTAIMDSITESTAVVLLSSVHWMNGLVFDLEAIGKKCRSVGAKLLVDGTQSVGALPIDVSTFQIDALICASYKWLFGPYSLGMVYIDASLHSGTPMEESWMNRSNAEDFSNLTRYSEEYTPDAGRYNVGETSNFVLMPMLKAALTQIKSWSVPEIQNYCGNLIKPLLDYLLPLGVMFENKKHFSPHLFSLNVPAGVDLNELNQNMLKNKVYLSMRGTSLRVSVNVFNTPKDIAKLVEVIDITRKQ